MSTTNEALLLDRKRRADRREWRLGWARAVGKTLPASLRHFLARRHAKLAYLCLADGDFVHPSYLGEFAVHIDVARSSIESEMLSDAFEKTFRSHLAPWVQPGDTVLDIGANVGALTLFFAQRVGPEGRVFAFEPGPPFHQRLQANLALNATLGARVKTYPMGLSSEPGSLFWNEDTLFPGNAGMLETRGTSVAVSTLDLFFPDLDRCDWIKIDVEGMELEVLRGAEQTLRRLRPKIVFESTLEFEQIRQAPVRQQAEEFLKSLGYRLYALGPNRALTPVKYPDFPSMTMGMAE